MTLPDADTIATYGGALNNYAAVEDPTTDRDAAAANKAYANVAMMSRMCPRAICRITTAASTGAMILVSYDSVWGATTTTAPVLARTGAGLFTITWPSTVVDELGVTHTLNFRWSHAICSSSSSLMTTTLLTAHALTLGVFNTSNTFVDAVGSNFDVFFY